MDVSFETELEPVTFADSPGFVTRYGKLFSAGDYPDKDFSLTEEELQNAVAEFEPADVDLAHVPSVLRGKLGQVTEVAAQGKTLYGKVQLPEWLDTLLEDSGRKVSTEWDRATKKLTGLAIVRDPRVSDAALMAAFSDQYRQGGQYARHSTPSGQATMQEGHDLTVQKGAVCSPVGMASAHEASAVQQAHDLFVQHGAMCEPPLSRNNAASGPPAFSTTDNTARSTRMNVTEWLFGKAKEDGVEVEEADIVAAFGRPGEAAKHLAPVTITDDQTTELKAQLETLRKVSEAQTAAFAKLEAEKQKSDAASFARSQVDAHRISPAAMEPLTALVERIAASDSVATFSGEEKPTVTLLADFIAALPDLSMFTAPQVKDEAVAALFNQLVTPDPDKPSGPNQSTIDKMLASTPDGRIILAERAKSNGKS